MLNRAALRELSLMCTEWGSNSCWCPSWWPALFFAAQNKFHQLKQDIFHPGYVLTSNVMFTSDWALISKKLLNGREMNADIRKSVLGLAQSFSWSYQVLTPNDNIQETSEQFFFILKNRFRCKSRRHSGDSNSGSRDATTMLYLLRHHQWPPSSNLIIFSSSTAQPELDVSGANSPKIRKTYLRKSLKFPTTAETEPAQREVIIC